ncbi:MAG: hypothetical protein EOO73_33440 [Myxococcales bacterium]|nr:MAG: hypothetical protein EOO73_33440 [Myxococcales bacterium]
MAAVEGNEVGAGGPQGWGAWRVVAALVFILAAGASGWFLYKSGFLTRALSDHYARTIARFGREVELRAGSYRSVLGNLTQLPGVVEEPSPIHRLLLGAEARVLAVRKAEQAQDARRAALARALKDGNSALEAAQALRLVPRDASPPVDAERIAPAREGFSRALSSVQLAFGPLAEASAALIELDAEALAAQKVAELALRSDAQAEAEDAKKQLISKIGEARARLAEAEKPLTVALLELAARARALQLAMSPKDPRSALAEQLEELAGNGQDAVRSLRSVEDGADQHLVRDRQILQSVLPSYQDLVASCLAASEQSANDLKKRNAERDLCVARGLARRNEGAGDSARRSLELSSCAADVPRDAVTLNRERTSLTFPPNESGASLEVCGRLGLARLLAGLGPPQGGLERTAPHAFDALMLLDSDGSVLVGPPGDSPLRVMRVPGFDAARATASHVMSEVSIGPRKYSLFLQPLELSLVTPCLAATPGCSAGKRPAQLMLAGLVFEDRLASERLEVTPGTYLWAIVLLSCVVLALPLAKLWLLAPTSRLRRFDVSLLLASAAATTLLVTLVSLSAAAFLQLRAAVDEDLKDVGSAIARTVERRTDDGIQLLESFAADTLPLQRAAAVSNWAELMRACDEPAAFVASLGACERLEAPLSLSSGARWEQAFLTDPTGQQRVKWTVGKETTNLVNVARRAYYKRATARACTTGAHCGDTYALEVVRSLTTGALQLVVAKAFGSPRAPEGGVGGVAGITLPLPEFQRVVLPLGFQLAVLDRDGKVMLHSGSSAFQGQNFLDDVDSPSALRAAITKRGESWLSLRYLGERSRARVESLPTSGWSVVVVAPLSLIDLPLSQSVLITVAALALLAVAALCAFGLALFASRYLRGGRRNIEQDALLTLRPRAASLHDYQDVIRFVTVTGPIAPVLALMLPYGLMPLVLLAGCGLVAFGALMRVPGVGRNGALSSLRPTGDGRLAWLARLYVGDAAGEPSRYRAFNRLTLVSVYGACCFSLAAVAVTAPVCVLFAGAHDHMLETLARAQQQHLAREVVSLDCLNDKARLPSCEHVYVPRARAAVARDVWGAAARSELLEGAESWLPQFEPVRGSAASLLALSKSPTDPPNLSWIWERAGRDLRLGPTNQVKSAGLHSDLPTLLGPCAVLPLLGLTAWALASYLISLRVFDRLFHMRLLQELGQHSLEDLAIALVNRASAQAVAVNVFIPNLSDLELAILEAKVDGLLEPPPIWTREAPFRALPGEPEPSWVIATFQGDPLAPATPQALEDLRDYDELRRAPTTDPHLTTHAAPKREALQELWARCDADEKRVLSQIALDDYANPHPNTALVLERLAKKGLIESSTLAIPRRAFVDYILGTLGPADLEQWARAEKNTSWTAMRGVLVAALATLAAVLTALQPSLGAATATVPALAAAIPTLLRMLNLFAGSEAK